MQQMQEVPADGIVIGLGFIAVRLGVFAKVEMRILGKYVVNFALPALVFTALSQRPVNEILNGRYLLGYAAGSLSVRRRRSSSTTSRSGNTTGSSSTRPVIRSASRSCAVGAEVLQGRLIV